MELLLTSSVTQRLPDESNAVPCGKYSLAADVGVAAFVLMLADKGRQAPVQKLAVCFVCGGIGTYLVS
ncbi:MAG: hypothetical protein WA799_05290 [Nitrosotalea sp.]